MGIPVLKFKKKHSNTGVTKQSVAGILAIISVASAGPQNVPAMYTDPQLAYGDFSDGPLAELAAYEMDVSQRPAVLIRANPSTPGAYGTMTYTGTGTTTPSGTSGTHPYDDYPNVTITFLVGGTVGTTGIVYTYSLDGESVSAPQALGTATTIVIPKSGVSIDLTHSSNTVVAGDTITFSTTGPLITTSDLTTSLEALRVSGLAWEGVLVDRLAASSTELSELDTWLQGLEGVGKFRFGAINTRGKNSGETEASYLTAMTTLAAGLATDRIMVGAELGQHASDLTGNTIPRATVGYICAVAMGTDVGVDPASVEDVGNVPGCAIRDAKNNPVHHDEQDYPGLDGLGFSTLRTWNGFNGVFVGNARIMSTAGSDYVFLQHARVANAVCEAVYQFLASKMSKGVAKNLTADPNTGKVTIQEGAARRLEDDATHVAEKAVVGQVSGVKVTLSRDDDLSSNQGAVIHVTVAIEALAYIKEFDVTVTYVRSLA